MRVLVVEDEPLIVFVIEDAIDALGTKKVGPVATLKDALSAARSEAFDCAMLDVNICGEYVYPVADLLLERNIPFFLATGYAAATLPAHLAGIRRLTKPYTVASWKANSRDCGCKSASALENSVSSAAPTVG